MALGVYGKAIDDFGAVLELEPDHAGALSARASARIEYEQFEEAIQDFDRLIELAPDDAHAYYRRGMARVELGQYTEAVADLDQAARLDPQHPFAESDRKAAAELAGGDNSV